MKTLILLTAAEMPDMIVGLLPSLGELTDTYYPGTLRAEKQPDIPYPLIFSQTAKTWGKTFYVCADGAVDPDTPDPGFPRNLQRIDCLIVDLTAENPDYAEIDEMLAALAESLKENGESCRLLLLCTPSLSDGKEPDPPTLSEDAPGIADNPDPEYDPADGEAVEELPEVAPVLTELPFLITGCTLPADPVDLDTLCALLFPRIEPDDLADIYEEDLPDQDPPKASLKTGILATLFDFAEVFCTAMVCVILLLSFGIRRSPVEGSSMYPTLVGHNASAVDSNDPEHGVLSGYDDLLISNLFYSPKRLDIVIIQEPSQLSEPIVKRIIGLGGDTIKINFDSWEVFVNGELLDEPYINKKDTSLGSQHLKTDENNCWEGTVPEGCIFVLGDNRAVSKDSRTFGFIDERYIIGKVVFRIAPLDRFGTVEES